MRYVVTILLGLALTNEAVALSAGIFLEELSGQCQGTDSAKGVLPEIPEALSLDISFSSANGGCQMVASLLLNGSEQPSIDLQISSSGGPVTALGTGLGEIIYEFQVAGPPNTFIDINVLARASISGSKDGLQGTGSWGSGAIGGLPGDLGTTQGINLCSFWGTRPAACLTGPEGGADTTLQYQTSVRSNYIFSVILFGRASASAGFQGGGSSTNAEVQLVLDPTFSFVNPEDAAFYTLEYSPNLTAVPLPATAPMLATGLLAAGSWVRRRRAYRR